MKLLSFTYCFIRGRSSFTPIDYFSFIMIIKSEKYFEVELDASTQIKGLCFDYFVFVKGLIPLAQLQIANSTKE